MLINKYNEELAKQYAIYGSMPDNVAQALTGFWTMVVALIILVCAPFVAYLIYKLIRILLRKDPTIIW